LDDRGEDALSELAGELAARAESRRGDEDEDEDDEEEDIETDAELRAFIMEALAGELDDEDLFEGVDVDAGVERLVESMKEFDFGKAMNGLADLHESSSAEDEDLGSSSFSSPSFSVGGLARFSDSDESPTSATILARWFAAAKSGDADILRDMLREDPSLLHARSSGLGHTAAHWAAAKGHADVVAWLVDARGYEVDFPNACGATALHAAAANGWEECVSVLLSLGASVDAEDEIGETPCDAAVRMQRGEALVVALGGDPGRAAIFCAPCEPSFESTTAAVLPVVEEEPERDDEGDDENAPIPDDDRRVVVLEREIQRRWLDAAKTGDLDAMRALFAENEDVLFSQGVGTSYGFSGNTALHWAAAKGHAACVRWLYASGIDPNVKNNGDGTAAHSAAGAGALDSLRILAHECGAKMDLLNSVDETPLDVAAHANHGDVVEFLRTAHALERLREEFSRDDACSTKLAKIVVHARASSDLSCRGLTEKSEIVQKAREIVDALPARISRERERERPLFRSAAEATRDDDRVDDTVVALAKKRGNTHFAAGDYEAAIKSYSMAIRLDRANAVLFSNRSAARLGAGAVEDALADAKTAVRLAPEVGKYYARQAAALNDMGQHAEALEVCRRGLARDASCHALTVVADESERRLREGRARYDAMWGDRDREKT
jgi:ankyrin repeat protein